MSEERIEPGDRVKLTPSGREGTVVWVDGEHVGVHFDATPEAWQRPVLCTRTLLRLVAKARYEPVEEEPEPAEDPVVAEVRKAFEDRPSGGTLERIAENPHLWPVSAPVARAVLALIEDRNRLSMRARSTFEELTMVRAQSRRANDELRGWKDVADGARDAAEAAEAPWRAATGCDTPDEARQRIEELQDRSDAGWTEAHAAKAEVARLTARAEAAEKERDEARAKLDGQSRVERTWGFLNQAVADERDQLRQLRAEMVDLLIRSGSPSVVSDETEATE